MAWFKATASHDDGNAITYPVRFPSFEDKLYSEVDINNIAIAIGSNVKVSEMAEAVSGLGDGGLKATKITVHLADYMTE